jgi:SOS response regulatory protein OraA/RecX
MDIEHLKKILSALDFKEMNKEELKKDLMMHGWQESQIDAVFQDLDNSSNSNSSNVKEIELSDDEKKELAKEQDLVDKIRMLEKKGMTEEQIEEYLKKQDFLELDIKRAHTLKEIEDDKAEEYLLTLKNHIIPFIEKGYNSYYIKRQFVAAGWDSAWFDKAYPLAEKEVVYSRRSLVLEKEILHRLISGENKEHVAKTLMKQGWPDDILKKNFENLDHGIEHLKNALYEIDLNHYNKDEIKKVLVEKGWPEELVDLTLNNIISKVKYHRDLQRIQAEVRAMMHMGKSSKEIETKLMSEGFDKEIVDKIIMKLNLELVRSGEVEKLKQFNNTQLKHKNYHNYNDLTSHFESIDKKNVNLDIKESLKKNPTSSQTQQQPQQEQPQEQQS